MKRTFLLAVTGALCAGFVYAADEPLPKAEALLDRYVEVSGGKAAYEKRRSEVVTGTMEFVGKGIKGSITTYSDSSNNNYTVIELDGIGKMESGVYNGTAWESSAIQGTRIREGDEAADAIRDATFNAPLHWRKLYTKAETVGVEDVGGEPAYKITLTPATGKPQTIYMARKSGLMVKRVATVSNPMGEIPMEMTLSNYKDFDGVLAPTLMMQKVMGQEFSITVDSVKTNADIPKERMEPPAEVKKLMAKPAAAGAR